jgi:hypothetical protein
VLLLLLCLDLLQQHLLAAARREYAKRRLPVGEPLLLLQHE